jgi:hypothetical protein
MPGPWIGWPTNMPRLLRTFTVVLAAVVAVGVDLSAGAAKFAVVTALVVPPIVFERVTTPVP